MIDEFQKELISQIEIETIDDLMEVLDVLLPNHSIDIDNDQKLLIYTNWIAGDYGILIKELTPPEGTLLN
jgi:hypothetical protein